MLVCTDKANKYKYNYVGITSAFFSVSLLLLSLVCQIIQIADVHPTCGALQLFRIAAWSKAT